LLLLYHRPIQRFWVLETVARIPYFAYISILHLYESLGFWRAGAELRKVHFAEEWNELHHLQVSLGSVRALWGYLQRLL
jgi:ubiquinol oxidase